MRSTTASARSGFSASSKNTIIEVETEEYETRVEAARLSLKPIARERLAICGGRSARMAAVGVMGGFASAGYASSASFMCAGAGGFGGFGGRIVGDSKLAIDLEAIVEKRQQQKADLVILNERLADYVEKSRFLEAQNRRLLLEAENMKTSFSVEAVNIKARYLLEIEEIKRLITVSETRRIELTAKETTATTQFDNVVRTLTNFETTAATNLSVKDRLYIQLGEMEGELSILRRRVGDFDLERKRYSHIITHLREEESELRRDLEHEKMATMVSKSTVQQLRDELLFITETHQTKMNELTALAYRDTTAENRAIWRSEFTEAFRALHEDYMVRLDDVHMQAETSFAVTVQQQQTVSSKDTFEISHFVMETQRTTEQITVINTRITELTTKIAQYESQLLQLTTDKTRITDDWIISKTRLEEELANYRIELANTKAEVQTILDDKLSLEMEIASYKQLLDSEEGRINASMDVALLEQGRIDARLAQRSMIEAATGSGGGAVALAGGVGAGGGYSYSAYSASRSSGGGAGIGYGVGGSSSGYKSTTSYSMQSRSTTGYSSGVAKRY